MEGNSCADSVRWKEWIKWSVEGWFRKLGWVLPCIFKVLQVSNPDVLHKSHNS